MAPMPIRSMHHLRATAVLASCFVLTYSFVPLQQSRPRLYEETTTTGRKLTALHASRNDGVWMIQNDFKLFLTQCSIQSFLFLVRQMHDPQTVLWLEGFTKPNIVAKTYNFAPTTIDVARSDESGEVPKKTSSSLLQYHGLGALNTTLFPTWDIFFQQLLQQPSETLVIESDRPHVPSYELDIDPSSLCSRIISVRDQISREFVKDLQVIANMGGQSLDSYWESLRLIREGGKNDGEVKMQRQNLLFLEFNADETSDYAPSPLRKGNFDLLMNLATQESVHRLLNDEGRQNGAEKVTNEFLSTFYTDRLHYFVGNQRYGRADDFLEEILSSPPRMIQVNEGTSLIDPIRIAGMILNEREKVALEWKELALRSPMEHMAIQKMRLNRLMGMRSDSESSFQ